MAARAIWKGNLKLNATKIPVKLYSAVQDRTVRFHILDNKAKQRVKQHMIKVAMKCQMKKCARDSKLNRGRL